jgi:hypothetical protein
MFYGRPPIEALGWDLTALPVPYGSRNFHAVTKDGRPLDMRFSSGWLTLERGDPGSTHDDAMTEVLSMPISPFGTIDITPEQLCDILGLTVMGEPIPAPDEGSVNFDWSGRTMTWSSTHRMLPREDAEILTAAICEEVEGVVLLQPVWRWTPARVSCRTIRFLMASDDIVSFAVGLDPARLARLRNADDMPLQEFERLLDPRIDLWWNNTSEDLSGQERLRQRAPGLRGRYDVTPQRRYHFSIRYRVADDAARASVTRILQILERHICRGLERVDLETGEVLGEDYDDPEDARSYSVPFRDWCRERPDRFIAVDFERDGTRERYVGYRPLPPTGKA